MKVILLKDAFKGMKINHQLVEVSLLPAEITSRTGITFEEDYDDLFNFTGCILEFQGAYFFLQQYHYSPDNVLKTLIRGSEEAIQHLPALMQSLKVNPAEVTWQNQTKVTGPLF